MVLHSASGGDDGADAALVQDRPRLLVRAAQERVGRAADLQAFGSGQIAQGSALFQRQHQRLFGIGVLARLQYPLGDRKMGVRDRQVDDDVDFRVGQQVIDRLRLGIEFGGAGFGKLQVDIRDRTHFDALEQGGQAQIGGRDIAAADDADAEFCAGFCAEFCAEFCHVNLTGISGWQRHGWQSGGRRTGCHAPARNAGSRRF